MTAKAESFLYSGYTFIQEREFKQVRENIRSDFLKQPAVLRNTLPKAIATKIGEARTAELCIKNGYRSRRGNRIVKCPKCGSYYVYFRNGARDGIRGIRCRKCKHIEPLPYRC